MGDARVSDIYNYRAVDARLSTSGQPTEDELRAVAREGFEVVINLALHDDPRYSLRDETGLVQSLGMRYVHIPVQFAAPTEADLDAFIAAMAQHRARRILVHCAANKRVTSFLGLYRVIQQGWREEEAFALMHSVWEPDAVWASFIAAMLERTRG